jgi:hypothetical protein
LAARLTGRAATTSKATLFAVSSHFLGGRLVTHYRMYKLDRPKGRIVKGKDMDAPSDLAAMTQAKADEDCPVCEVWQGAKKVGSVE